jgi:methyl-accepting chemotaxis protein
MFQEISAASHEQTHGTLQVNNVIQQLNSVTQQDKMLRLVKNLPQVQTNLQK